MKSNSKIVGGAASATNASSVTAQFDCTGYGFVKIFAIGDSTFAVSTSSNTLVESETAGGTTNSVYAQTDIVRSSAATVAGAAKLVWGVPMQGRKPFLKATFTAAGTGQYFLVAEMSEPYDTANSRSQSAVGSYCNI